jgi:hypothetical protein
MVRTGRVAMVRGVIERKYKRGIAVWKARVNGQEDAARETRLTTGGV